MILSLLATAALAGETGDAVPTGAIEVLVDPRVELVTAVTWIASGTKGYGGGVDRGYAAAAREWFAPHVNQKAIRLSIELSDGEFVGGAPIGWSLHHALDLSPDAPLPPEYAALAGDEKTLNQYSKALGNFIARSDFNDWMASQSGWRLKQIAQVQLALGQTDWVGALEGFYGEARGRYVLVVAPLVGHHTFDADVVRTDKTWEVYQVLNPASAPGDALDGYVRSVALRDFGHTFADPIVEANWGAFEASADLFPQVQAKLVDPDLAQWRGVVEEHLVRAAEVVMTRDLLGDEAAEELLQRHLSAGFDFLPPLVTALEIYAADRTQWPTLMDYGDELAAALSAVGGQ